MKNNKFNIIAIFTLLFSATIFIACSNDNETEIDTVSELQNPLEFIGIEHNKFMKEFTSQLEDSYKKNQWSKVKFLSDDYVTQFSSVMNDSYHKSYKKTTSTVEIQKNVYGQLNLNEWFDNDNETSLEMAKSVLRKGTHSKKAKEVLKNKASNKDEKFTINLLEDINTTSTKSYSSEEEAYKALEEVVMKHEKLILSQEWSSEEKYALGAVAVAKHSVQFWKNYDFSVFSNSKIARKHSSKNDDEEEDDPRSSIIVGADVAGYVVGGVVGGVAGVAVGPVTLGAGTVAGVLGGKAVGAWAGSAAAATAIAIYDAWSDFFN